MNPPCPLLFCPAFRRCRHVVQIALHVIIIKQATKPTTLLPHRFFDKMHPLPQAIGSVRNEQDFRFRIHRQHRKIIAQHLEDRIDVFHRSVEHRRDRPVYVAVFVQKVNAKKFRFPPFGRITRPIFVRFRSFLVFANANPSAVDAHDDLSPLDFQRPKRCVVRPQGSRLKGGGTNGSRYSREGNVDSLIGERKFSVPHGAESGGGLGKQIKCCRRETFGNSEQRKSRMKALAFFRTFFIFREKPGDDFDSVSAEKEDVDITPSANAKGRFLFEDQELFFLSCSSASRASCSRSCRWTCSATLSESNLSECRLTRYSKSRRDSPRFISSELSSRVAASSCRRRSWRFSLGRSIGGKGNPSRCEKRHFDKFWNLRQDHYRPLSENAPG